MKRTKQLSELRPLIGNFDSLATPPNDPSGVLNRPVLVYVRNDDNRSTSSQRKLLYALILTAFAILIQSFLLHQIISELHAIKEAIQNQTESNGNVTPQNSHEDLIMDPEDYYIPNFKFKHQGSIHENTDSI